MATCLPLLTTSKVPSRGSLDDSHDSFPPSKRLKLDNDSDGAVGKSALAKFTINVRCSLSLSYLQKNKQLMSVTLSLAVPPCQINHIASTL